MKTAEKKSTTTNKAKTKSCSSAKATNTTSGTKSQSSNKSNAKNSKDGCEPCGKDGKPRSKLIEQELVGKTQAVYPDVSFPEGGNNGEIVGKNHNK